MTLHHDVHDFEAEYYVAGPMTGIADFNYPYFNSVVTRLRFCGFTIHSPHEVPWPENHATMIPDELWEYMMAQTGKLLKQSNAIILLRGWSKSRGARKELEYALDHDFPVYFYLDPPGRPLNMTRMK